MKIYATRVPVCFSSANADCGRGNADRGGNRSCYGLLTVSQPHHFNRRIRRSRRRGRRRRTPTARPRCDRPPPGADVTINSSTAAAAAAATPTDNGAGTGCDRKRGLRAVEVGACCTADPTIDTARKQHSSHQHARARANPSSAFCRGTGPSADTGFLDVTQPSTRPPHGLFSLALARGACHSLGLAIAASRSHPPRAHSCATRRTRT